ncbi:MAG: transposase, partial [Actinobacteria bacterium]|nr:transposase [Actinomycetota bacterium]
LKKRTLCLSELARSYPTSEHRRVPAPKHDLLHRIKRLWRFIGNERVDPLAVQLALVTYIVARLGYPRLLGLAIDWTMFDTTLPSVKRIRYQVLRIAVPRRGRALPLLQLARSVRPVVLADRGFHRTGFIAWLEAHHLDYVVRLKKGSCITEADGRRWKLGEEGLRPGELLFSEDVRYGLHHGRPRELFINVALSAGGSQKAERKTPDASSLPSPGILLRASKTPKAPLLGTGKEGGSNRASRTQKVASGSPGSK